MEQTLSAHSAQGAAEMLVDVDFILTQSPGRQMRGSHVAESRLNCVFLVGNGGLLQHQNQPQLRKHCKNQSESSLYGLKGDETLRGGGGSGKGPGSWEL